MNKQDVLAPLNFGKRVAEEEGDELTKYFVETDLWRRLFSGDVDVVYGPKGSGKSALYALLLARHDQLFDRSIVLAPAENPRGTPAFKDLVADPPASEREFIGLWKLYFATLIAGIFEEYDVSGGAASKLKSALEGEDLILKDRSLRSVLRAVGDYVRRATRPESIEAGIEIDPMTGLPKGFRGKITFEEPSASGVAQGFQSVDHLLEAADEALSEPGFSLWILLDRLDVAFAENAELEQNALRALFHVYLDMLAYRHLRLKIFLRTDIWRRITTTGFREASHITRNTTISWNRQTLLNLVVSRAIQNEVVQEYYQITSDDALSAAESQEEFFYRMCPRQVEVGPNKPETFDWMLGRTRDGTKQTAPRELIHLLNSTREVQVRRLEIGEPDPEGEQLFDRVAFKEALSEVSRVRLEQTLFAEYPRLRKHLESLRGEKTQHTANSLARIWSVSADKAANIAQELLEVGFFEERGSKEVPEFWVPFLYRDALDLVQGKAEP